MKRATLEKIEQINQRARIVSRAQVLSVVGQIDLTIVFGQAAVKKAFADAERARAQRFLCDILRERHDKTLDLQSMRYVSAYYALTVEKTGGRSLRSLFPCLTSGEAEEVKKDLRACGFVFRGNRVEKLDMKKFRQPK